MIVYISPTAIYMEALARLVSMASFFAFLFYCLSRVNF